MLDTQRHMVLSYRSGRWDSGVRGSKWMRGEEVDGQGRRQGSNRDLMEVFFTERELINIHSFGMPFTYSWREAIE